MLPLPQPLTILLLDIAIILQQVLELLDSGERHRHFGETKMNKNSSRSHTIFRMVVESRSRDANPDDAQVRQLISATAADSMGASRHC